MSQPSFSENALTLDSSETKNVIYHTGFSSLSGRLETGRLRERDTLTGALSLPYPPTGHLLGARYSNISGWIWWCRDTWLRH